MIWAATINVSVNVILADFLMNNTPSFNTAKANTIMAAYTVGCNLRPTQSFSLATRIGGPADSSASR